MYCRLNSNTIKEYNKIPYVILLQLRDKGAKKKGIWH